jgi:hypothetical protein
LTPIKYEKMLTRLRGQTKYSCLRLGSI